VGVGVTWSALRAASKTPIAAIRRFIFLKVTQGLKLKTGMHDPELECVQRVHSPGLIEIIHMQCD
jgi:hypothetical protein